MWRGNPFLVRERQRWQRSPRRSLGRILTLLLVLIALCAAAWLPRWDAEEVVAQAMVAWALMAAVWTLWRGGSSCPCDDESGMMQLVSVTPMRPWTQAVGRWLGVLVPIWEVLLLGLLFLAPLTVLEIGYTQRPVVFLHTSVPAFMLLAWVTAALWIPAIAALSLLGANLCPRRFAGVYVAFAVNWVACGHLMLYATLAPSYVTLWPAEPEFLRYLNVVVLRAGAGLTVGLLGTVALTHWRNPILDWAARIRPSHDPLLTACRAIGNSSFHRSWPEGLMRLNVDAVPGHAWAPAVVLVAVTMTILSHLLDDPIHYHRELLLAAAGIACYFGLFEALLLGYAVGTERAASTWPLLVSTGIRPATLLHRRFAAAFNGLSAEWTWTLPAWIATAAVTRDAAVLPMALLQPACIVTGFLVGIHFGTQPPTSLNRALPYVTLALIIVLASPSLASLASLDPASLTLTVAVAWALFLALLRRRCLVSLDRLLRGMA